MLYRTVPCSRDPDLFWTSGQWMTERLGGSDVSGATETTAVPETGHTYRQPHYLRLEWITNIKTFASFHCLIDWSRYATDVKG